MGYSWAGFYVVGVDIAPQPHYQGGVFVQSDALEVLRILVSGGSVGGYVLADFAGIHASPPCQRFSAMSLCRPGLASEYPDLIEPIRELLKASGLPYVIENVPRSPLIDPVVLCGQMFGRELYRHRLFESNFPIDTPDHPPHTLPASKAGHWTPGTVMSVAGHFAPVAHGRRIMGIDWMNREEMSEAVPPYYAEHVGDCLTAFMRRPMSNNHRSTE